jgi:hypothetical protein
VRAQLAGFKSQTRSVTVEPGLTITIPFTLALGCLGEILHVDMGTPWGIKEADAVVYLRIVASRPPMEWSFGNSCIIGVEHTATVLRVAKTSAYQPDAGARLRFVNQDAYARGQEFVALLKWDAAAARHFTMAPFYMFPVRNGRVTYTRTDMPALRDQMPVADFVSALKAAL